MSQISTVLPLFLLPLAALVVCLVRATRSAIVGLWACQMVAGAVLLGRGAEMLAISLWIASAIVSGVYFLHADILTESSGAWAPSLRARGALGVATSALPLSVSAGVGVLVWLVLSAVSEGGAVSAAGPAAGKPDESFILTQLLALISLAAVVASGVIVRAREEGPK